MTIATNVQLAFNYMCKCRFLCKNNKGEGYKPMCEKIQN